MRRRERQLVRLLRVLLACTALLFAAPGRAVALEPVRDVSAWVAPRRVAAAPAPAAPSPVAQRQAARRQLITAASAASPWGSARVQRAPRPPVAAAPFDRRQLYLQLRTLRC